MKSKHQNSRIENKVFLVRPKVSQDPSLSVRQCHYLYYIGHWELLQFPGADIHEPPLPISTLSTCRDKLFPKISVPCILPYFSFLLLLVPVYVLSCHRNCLLASKSLCPTQSVSSCPNRRRICLNAGNEELFLLPRKACWWHYLWISFRTACKVSRSVCT